jgi:Spy/CpxP family protein refolding chaperone
VQPFKEKQMFSRTKLTVSALILSLGACSATALAQQPQPANPAVSAQQPGTAGLSRRENRRRLRGDRAGALAQINLTDAQKEQMRTIMQNQSQSTRMQREELRNLMQQSRAGTLSAEQQARAKELRQQLLESRKGTRGQMMNILTAEQKAKLDETRALRKANHEMLRRRRPPVN